ncbi:MAG: hypothetical protein NTX79_06360 [Candidatus Micrarchaeota archaeon]|nr:hypothetical protein [Candidatus Micrarchaeota archaeon]
MVKTTKSARGGFFFAVMALAMLSLVLLTVQIWVRTFEQSDYSASQRFKGEAVRSILASLSDKTLSDFANASAFYATYKLVNYTSSQGLGLAQLPGTDEAHNRNTGVVENATIGLMINGSSPPNWAPGIWYSGDEMDSYTLAGWQNKTNAAANAMGFDIRFSDARNFRYYQIDPWTVGVSFDLEMNITDAEGTMRQNKTMHAGSSFPISGFLDPMISRKDMEHRAEPRDLATEKQIFKLGKYSVPADVQPTLVKDAGKEGYGWFFGPITELTPDEISPLATTGVTLGNIKQYVLVSPYNDGLAGIADSYGAVIVTEEPVLGTAIENGCNVTRQTRCLNCMEKVEPGPGCAGTGWELFPPGNNPVDVPAIAVNNWNMSDVTPVTRALASGDITDHYVLIDNTYELPEDKMKADAYHRVWDITSLRDMAICGFYVKGKGPSFFQRMLTGAEYIQNPDPGFGIESFVVGQWAGGAEDKGGDYAADLYSRLDWEFYQSYQGTNTGDLMTAQRIKGMMGCKSKEMCDAKNATTIGLGHFMLTDDATARYLSTLISCKETPAAPHAPC